MNHLSMGGLGQRPPRPAALISAAAQVVSSPLLPSLSIHPPKSCQSVSVFLQLLRSTHSCQDRGAAPRAAWDTEEHRADLQSDAHDCGWSSPAVSPPPSLAGPLQDQGRRPAHLPLQAFLFSPGPGCRNPSKLGYLFFLCSPSSLSSADLFSELPPSARSVV